MENNFEKEVPILNSTIQDIVYDSLYSSRKMFIDNFSQRVPDFLDSSKIKLLTKIKSEFKNANQKKPEQDQEKTENNEKGNIDDELDNITLKVNENYSKNVPIHQNTAISKLRGLERAAGGSNTGASAPEKAPVTEISKLIDELPKEQQEKLSKIPKKFLIFSKSSEEKKPNVFGQLAITDGSAGRFQDDQVAIRQDESRLMLQEGSRVSGILAKKFKKYVRPQWHAPWKLMRVITGHQGWVMCAAVDPTNKWFVTGSKDRTIKFWDMASGQLKLTLTGHINTVRGLAVSHKHTYLFSCGEDKTVRCWDLEYNKIIRNYHGHLSGVYCLSLHPTLDVLATGGRDSTVRIWDIRTRAQVHVLEGHSHVVASVISQEYEPQVVSGSHDNTIRLWDLATGKSVKTLTNHKKSIRSLLFHHKEYTFCSGGSDNLKVWKCPDGQFMRNISGHNSIVNCMALNADNVLVSGGDNGSILFWDWKSGYNFQKIQTKVQPGSISAEGGIFCSTFDYSSMRLITGECDKTIKIWKEDETATPETHPLGDIKMEFDMDDV